MEGGEEILRETWSQAAASFDERERRALPLVQSVGSGFFSFWRAGFPLDGSFTGVVG